MTEYPGLREPVRLDPQGLLDTIARKGTPRRVHHLELFQDGEIREAIARRYHLADGLDRADPFYKEKLTIAVHRFCGMEYVRPGLDGVDWTLYKSTVEDQAALSHEGGRAYQDEHVGPITSWDDLERYPWPDLTSPGVTRTLEWYQANLPDDMVILSGSASHFCEMLTWLMGYESFCYALTDQPALVRELARRLTAHYEKVTRLYLQFDRLKAVFASDDLGFRSGLLFSRVAMKELVLEPHAKIAKMAHAAGRPYYLHTCGNMDEIMDDLIDRVHIDAKHSFEDTIEDVRVVKKTYGRRIGLLGGIDVDFLCRADEAAIRARVRDTLDVCQPGGGYCLGTGNSVTNYIPLDSYLTMLDEGRRYGGSGR